jgi:hypothetical protein
MSNRFYANSFAPAIGSTAKSAAVRLQFDNLVNALTLVQAELDALRGSGGVTGLSGFPATFTGAALKYLQVNAAESSVQFVPGFGSTLGIKSVADTTYTLLAADAGVLLVSSAATPATYTVPPAASVSFAAGTVVCIAQNGAGQITVDPGAGVTLLSSDGLLQTRTQYAEISLVYLGADVWQVVGDRYSLGISGVAMLDAENAFTKVQTVTPVELTDAATIETDASLSNTFWVRLQTAGSGNRTLANPTNLVDGAIYSWFIKQGTSGPHAVTTFGNLFKFPSGIAPTSSTVRGYADLITGQYIASWGYIACTYATNIPIDPV